VLAATLPRSTDATPLSPPSLAAAVTQSLPPRNLYLLTDQLRLHPPRPIARVIRTKSPNYPIGHQDSFHVLSEDSNRYFTMHATIVARTRHLYIYVQNGMKVDQASAQTAANYFEQHIYPTDRSLFGSEWTPGVDGDPHITCLVGNLRSSGAAGFFSSEDEYPHVVNPWSNQREMIYINGIDTVPGDSSFRDYMSHEFQHMIHWHMHPRDNAWVNEGMSVLAENLNGFPPTGYTAPFSQSPTTQLNAWSLNDASTFPHYGGAFLFFQYLYDHYGRSLIKSIVADRQYTDFELINFALRQHHISLNARQVFANWAVANWLNDRSLDGGVYGYSNASFRSFRVTASQSRIVPFSARATIPAWAAHYESLDTLSNDKPFRLTFSAPTTVPLVGFSHASNSWWSNRGDMAMTSLDRTVNLQHVKHATLTYQTAYDIEKDYDYAYVEVSTDDGKTWTTLKGTDTTTANPYGANFGNGYTGRSKGWKKESVDLSRYAGSTVRLRFQYVTDDEYNGQGQLISHIAIPQIGYHDNGTGWTAHGFVHIGTNSLPSQWTVQLISTSARGASVSTLPLSGGHGSITIDPVKTGLKKLVVVVFSTAPKTTVPSTYTLSAVSTGS
jgi:hypothetical protein